MTKAERNDAIVKMYRDGYTQEAIGEMFGIDRTLVSKVAGAKERTERIVNNSHSEIRGEITAAHEQVLRKAPNHFKTNLRKWC